MVYCGTSYRIELHSLKGATRIVHSLARVEIMRTCNIEKLTSLVSIIMITLKNNVIGINRGINRRSQAYLISNTPIEVTAIN